MHNKGVSCLPENHMGTPRRAHEGSQSSSPMSGRGENASLGSTTMEGGVHNLGM